MNFQAIQSKKINVALLAKGALALTVAFFLWQFFPSSVSTWAREQQTSFTPTPSTTTTNVAVLIEDRPLSNIAPISLHFSTVLGPSWSIILFTTPHTHSILNQSAPFLRAESENKISVRFLPANLDFSQRPAISELLTSIWFWESLAPAEHVLLFQADSILCANAHTRIEEFFEYSFVGAPIDVPATGTAGHGEGFNGGLSLRNRSMILDILHKYNWKGEFDSGEISQQGCVTKEPCLKFEDQWFYHKMKAMDGARFPSKEVASRFAVETIWYDKPLGYHQVERWNGHRIGEVEKWCPEYKLASSTELLES